MVQSKLFDQTLLSEDKNDLSPSAGNPTGRPAQRHSGWRVSASLVDLLKVENRISALVTSKVRLKGQRALATCSGRT